MFSNTCSSLFVLHWTCLVVDELFSPWFQFHSVLIKELWIAGLVFHTHPRFTTAPAPVTGPFHDFVAAAERKRSTAFSTRPATLGPAGSS
jgi:hypothetical protein